MDFLPLWLLKLAWHVLPILPLLCPGLTTGYQLSPAALTISPPPTLNDRIIPECYNFTHGLWQEMEFYSPNYPHQYPNKIDCVMYLQAPPGFFLELVFMEKFAIEESEGCKYDYVELRDGPFGYSNLIARFCGESFPVTIQTTTRFLWTRFASDEDVHLDGFKAVYEYKLDETINTVPEVEAVCRIFMDNMAADGEINSKVFPLADTSRRDYPIEDPVDCTWEMRVEVGYRIRLNELVLHMPKNEQCMRNMIEIYDGTTSERDRTGVYCGGNMQDYVSTSNRIYLRIVGSRLSDKPVLFGRYTVFRSGECRKREFACDGMCLSSALVCNGHTNCPSGQDERACGEKEAAATDDAKPVPMMTIVLAAVGGLIFTIVVIGVCVTCFYRRDENKTRKHMLQKTDSQRLNTLEMAVNNSKHTSTELAKQNNQTSYYSLPRPSGQATVIQHRSSFSSKPPSEGEYGDHMSDTSAYKKFLQLEQAMDEDSSSPCPSPYAPAGQVFTTIVEHHPHGVTPNLGWGYQGGQPEQPASLAENLSKLQSYNKFTNSNAIPKPFPYSGDTGGGMTLDFRYDPSIPVYPATKFRIKSTDPQENQNWDGENQFGKSLTFKNQDADKGPDLTREIEAT